MGDTYPLVNTNITEMTGNTPGSASRIPRPGAGGSNRHCTAWEDFLNTTALICEDLRKIDAIIGYGENTSGIMAAAQAAIMRKNRGE